MTVELNLNFLKELEQETVLEVLYRDQMLRKVDEERIRKLKTQLQQLRWKGAKNASHEYQERSCARCQKSLGLVMNRGAVCNGCSHRVCSECRVCLNPYLWKCTICYAHGAMKVKTGEWFFEERAKKFPGEGRRETIGAKLLKSYQKLSKISVVPPTPPPFTESTGGKNTTDLDQAKTFNKSVENLFLSLATHIRKVSKSHDDVTADKSLLTTDYGQDVNWRRERRSQSDTAINIASRIQNAPSLQQLIIGTKDNNAVFTKKGCRPGEDLPSSPLSDVVFCGGVKHGSLFSLNSTCTEADNFDKANITGEIEFAIKYIFKTCTLEVCINACKNLAYGEEKKKKCNPVQLRSYQEEFAATSLAEKGTKMSCLTKTKKPGWDARYVKTYLLPDKTPRSKRKTIVRKGTVDPAFHEILKYTIDYSQLETRQLQISVWHAGVFKNRVFLGEVLIPLSSWNFEDNSMQSYNWYQLKAKPEDNQVQYSGELLVRAKMCLPSPPEKFRYEEHMMEGTEDRAAHGGQLHLVVLEAKNLPELRSVGSLNAFVKGCLVLPDQRELKQKSPVLRKETCPHWKHLFVFDGVTPSQLQCAYLDLTIWNQASFGLSDRFLGGARLSTQEPMSSTASNPQAKVLWQRILSRPNTWMDITLALQSNKGVFKF
ncbi:PREDICTED: synaptotagmin-like protein 3 isoform X1 [Gavialis gangeticus]|uniref:synaptotagmin-like protein 3 isoform X1 n=2 Tax=Gavialis gangeticus TaxID=94835 RepID=UPI00092E5B03|nr:PREDICTED: synaptotagmin-like protein 3 isoform X1 [Gavialis gangeticus]